MKCRGKHDNYMIYSALYHVFPATFHVISRTVDFLWDSVMTNENLNWRCPKSTQYNTA